jgi:LysR family glycine cleavage system transcriptional activator
MENIAESTGEMDMASLAAPFSRRMPPLNPLRAFEVAARHLSFTHAADELCVTQGAISRSVKALEEYLGEPLFERTGHGLALTERSEALALKLSDGFMRIGEAADQFRGIQASPILTVRTYTSFLIGFLIPNLPDFQMKHPDIRVRLVSATDSTEFARDIADVRIRYGRGNWKNAESTLLFRDSLRPLCSPSLLDPAKRPYRIEELSNHVLLHQEMRRSDWPGWLSMVSRPDLRPRDNLVFDELSIVYQAAMAGAGLVMAQRAYFRRELASGCLFEPFELILNRDLAYYLTVPLNRCDAPHVRRFKRWLLDALVQAELSDPAPPVLTGQQSGHAARAPEAADLLADELAA